MHRSAYRGTLAFLTTADARRGGVHRGGGHTVGHVRAGGSINRNANINRNRNVNVNRNRTVSRHVDRNVNRRYAYRNGRRGYWRNGVWIAAPAIAGAAAYNASCAYEYSRWKSAGSAYWRERYYQCTH
jgi:hypothetical protein